MQTLNSVIDHRSVFVQLSICGKIIEAVCDSGASVSCLSSNVFDQIKQLQKLKLEPTQDKLVAANKLPIQTRGKVLLLLKIGPKQFEHVFHVLEHSEADCLIGLDFLKKHRCDPLISKDVLRLDDDTQVPLYHREIDEGTTSVFRVVVSETVSVPAGHSMIVPALMQDWKRPLHETVAIFEPNDRFDGTKEAVAPNILFNLAEPTVPVTVENTGDEPLTIYEKTTLGTSENLPIRALRSISPPKSEVMGREKLDPAYDLKYVIDSVSPEIPLKLKKQFGDLVNEFEDVFSKNQWDIGRCDATSHKIDVLPGSKPIKLPNRRMPLHYKEDLQEKIDAFLDKQLIEPCHSPYSAPAMFVPKKNGKLRLVIDYRQLNNQTIKSCWPIPSIEEIFDTLEGSAFFSTIDMSWGFYQIPMDEKSQDYTAFSTPFGSFKWLRMPMGLSNSPPTFQSLMEIVLSKLIWKTVVPYLDDCIIFAATPDEHIRRIREVLVRFRAANLKINPLKCEFFRTKVQFLGHVISKDGLQVDPEKIAAVKQFPVPAIQTHVKSFLGLCSYYRRYVKNFADIARPLHKASETTTPFKWTPEAQDAFDKLKACLTTTPILAFPSMKEPFILYTDASLSAMGAVLAQVQDGKERAICYASKALSRSQMNYSATKRELLAVVHFTRHFKHYLLGRKFILRTDHSALRWLHNFKDPDGLVARWLEKLAQFDYEVEHRPGKSIGHADGLSRIPTKPVLLVSEEPNVARIEQTGEWPNAQSARDINDIPPAPAPIPGDVLERLPSKCRVIRSKSSEPLRQRDVFEVATEPKKYTEINGDLFDSKDSIAHCVSADFKMSSGIARSIKRKYPTVYPGRVRYYDVPLWTQWLPETKRYIYHLLTKDRFYHKPTYAALRAPLERMREHAEAHGVMAISIPQIGCGLDQLEWPLVRTIIQEIFEPSDVRITVYIRDPSTPVLNHDETEIHEAPDTDASNLTENIRKGQDADESLHLVREWVRRGRVPRNNDLKGCPELAWKLYNQFHSLYLMNDVLCRRFEPTGGDLPFLQQVVPPALVDDVLSSLHSSITGGHLGIAKLLGKVRRRFWWPGFKEDVQLFLRRCVECQKRRNPPQTHRHSLVEWKPSFPFQQIGIDFMGPLPESNGNKFICLIGDHFTKWYEAIPLPDQKATTTASALIEHWISRFGCPHSIHSDQGRNFESHLFKELLQLLEIEKTRTTAFHPQSNAVIERMNRTLQNMLAKCVEEDQRDWSMKLPYVMMAYRSSVHESTGFSPQFLVQGRELTLPIDVMYPNPDQAPLTTLDDFVYKRKKAFQRAFELVRSHLHQNQTRRNALYNQKVHGPTYENGQKVLLHNPAVSVGQTPKLSSPWRGPYIILDCLNDVTYKIREIATNKESVVHYDRLKLFFEPPASSNVPTRVTRDPDPEPLKSNVPTRNRPDSEPPTDRRDHSTCGYFQQIPMAFSMTSLSPRTPTVVSTSTVPHSPVPPMPSRTSSPVSTAMTGAPLPPAMPITPPSAPTVPMAPSAPSTPVGTAEPSRTVHARTLIERAADTLRRTAGHSYNLRPNTGVQRRAQPLHEASLPTDLINYQSPRAPDQIRQPRNR